MEGTSIDNPISVSIDVLKGVSIDSFSRLTVEIWDPDNIYSKQKEVDRLLLKFEF